MSNSINTNIAAYYAQQNITTASNAATKNVAQLSSGNAIINASDDVAALAVGTSIGTQVNALNTAQTNAAQGSSLLQVADGALAQIQSILQQQQSIADQAESGALTNTDRGFLDQEFQQLTSEINALATGTSFNGVNLIDGSIATGGSNNPLRDATIGSTSAGAASDISGFTAESKVTAISFALDTTTANDTTFIGALSGGVFAVTPSTTDAGHMAVSYALNGSVYTGMLATTSATSLALNNGQGTITFTVSVSGVTGATLQTQLGESVAGANSYAIHKVATTLATDSNGNTIAGSAITASATAGTLLDGFSGTNVTLQSQLFNGLQLPTVSNWSATGFGSNVVFSVVINGTTYSSAGTVAGTDTTISTATFNGGGAGIIQLYAKGNLSSNEVLKVNLNGVGAGAKITTSADTQNLVNALNTAFGSGGNQGGLTFQLGTSTAANVTVNIANSQSTALFAGTPLDVKTASDAAQAATAVGNAISTVTATRSQVGAYETQFNFAAAALQSSDQNETAAQSQLLDTNVATVSTQYATNQVKLQAGISVLAQANTETQAYLKLITG